MQLRSRVDHFLLIALRLLGPAFRLQTTPLTLYTATGAVELPSSLGLWARPASRLWEDVIKSPPIDSTLVPEFRKLAAQRQDFPLYTWTVLSRRKPEDGIQSSEGQRRSILRIVVSPVRGEVYSLSHSYRCRQSHSVHVQLRKASTSAFQLHEMGISKREERPSRTPWRTKVLLPFVVYRILLTLHARNFEEKKTAPICWPIKSQRSGIGFPENAGRRKQSQKTSILQERQQASSTPSHPPLIGVPPRTRLMSPRSERWAVSSSETLGEAIPKRFASVSTTSTSDAHQHRDGPLFRLVTEVSRPPKTTPSSPCVLESVSDNTPPLLALPVSSTNVQSLTRWLTSCDFT